MATLKAIKNQLEKIKTSGQESLSVLHGIELPENATVSGIIDCIEKIPPMKNVSTVSGLYFESEFPDGYELVLDIPCVKDLSSVLRLTKGLRKVTFKGRTQEIANKTGKLNCNYAFFNNEDIEIIDFTDFYFNPVTVDCIVYGASALKEIRGVVHPKGITSATRAFYNCPSLEEFRIENNSVYGEFGIPDSSLLSLQSIESIVESLMTMPSSKGMLYLHKDVVEKFTDEQKALVYSKNWTLVGC